METFHTDLPQVMHETIDGEVVVVNLDSGVYYSFDGVGGQIWDLLAAGGSIEAVRAQLLARYEGEPAQIAEAAARFIGRLRDEGLVRVAEAPSAGGSGAPTNGTDRQPFAEPVLQKYTDMEALLLADPIHEVDEAGWPNLK